MTSSLVEAAHSTRIVSFCIFAAITRRTSVECFLATRLAPTEPLRFNFGF
jgi:hypothetical protein